MQADRDRCRARVARHQPAFTGDVGRDFQGCEILSYHKQEGAAVRAATAWDDDRLYVAWAVEDQTPWINAATDPAASDDRQEAWPVSGSIRRRWAPSGATSA